MKYIKINVKINIDDLYENNYKILDSLFRKTRICRWIYSNPGQKIALCKRISPPKMYWFNIIPVKIPGVFFLEVGKVILRLI